MRLATALALLLAAPSALGQVANPPADDVTSAAAAFQEGQRLQLTREFARAAEFFEIADRSAPSPAALRSAIRSHQSAGHATRAATLALRARARDASDPQSVQLADQVIAEANARLSRVNLTCTPACTITVDRLATTTGTGETHRFFIDPGARALEVRWSGRGARTRSVEAAAGQSIELSLDAPPPEAPAPPPPTPLPTAPPPPQPVVVTPPPPPPPPVVAPARRPLPRAVFFAGLAATAVSAGILVWSGLDTLSARDAYVAAPSEAGFNDGTGRELRTNVLIATTATLGVATAVIGAFLTEWSPPNRERSQASTLPVIAPGNGGLQLGVIRSF